ncbi:MAG: hypothetical protein KAW67_09520 [Candidatus Eisenbacteria sp.]|nr:hypothetical protein [Candidatus Eisenbacteria bacterium]
MTRERFRFCCLLLLLLALGLAASCADVDPAAGWSDYLIRNAGEHVLTLPSGQEPLSVLINMGVEKREYAPRVVVNWMYMEGDQTYILDRDAIRTDLKYLGDLAVGFAKESGWSNDYYLYVAVGSPTSWSFTYDYEEDMLYVPSEYDALREMVRGFGSVEFREIASSEEGRRFLEARGFSKVTHGELEPTLDWSLVFGATKTVHVVRGEFSTYGM